LWGSGIKFFRSALYKIYLVINFLDKNRAALLRTDSGLPASRFKVTLNRAQNAFTRHDCAPIMAENKKEESEE
jgi:hypothetical protein